MDEFLKIDWHPPLEDLIEDVFINEERLKAESAMYRIMQNIFTDPFTDLESEDSEAEDENDDKDEDEKNESKNGNKEERGTKAEEAFQDKPRKYVPGLLKPSFRFPRASNLTREQQATCLRVLLRFSGSEKPEINATNRNEMELYMKLLPAIREEQEEFLDLAKSNWCGKQLKLIGKEYMKECWEAKVERVKKLPRYYVAAGNIPFKGEEKICLAEEATLLEMGQLPRVIMSFNGKVRYFCNEEKLRALYPASVDFRLGKVTVSQDPNCEVLAERGKVDMVISSGGLNCLASNFGPNYTSSWVLPIVVKENANGNVVYVDKPLPPTAFTAPQKNTWIYKYIIKSYLLHPLHCTSISLSEPEKQQIDKDESFGNLNSDELLRLEEENDELQSHGVKRKLQNLKSTEKSIVSQKRSTTNEAYLTVVEPRAGVESLVIENGTESPKELPPTLLDIDESCPTNENNTEAEEVPLESVPSEGTVLPSNVETNSDDGKDEVNEDVFHEQEIETEIDDPRGSTENPLNCQPGRKNVAYKIFSLGPSGDATNDCTKTKVEDYRILVRNQIDGIEKMGKGTLLPVMLVPKLEHQVALGAEAVEAEEALRQWTMLTYRPNTSLVRIRIAAETSEVIQVERRTAISINNEIKRLYNLNVEDSLVTLHNVVHDLKGLKPGNYLLRHTPTNGAFATIYQESDSSGKNAFDLHENYVQSSFQTICNVPWPPLDKVVVTPAQKCFERMPAMYFPRMDSDIGSKGTRGRGRDGRGRGRGVSRGGGRGGSHAAETGEPSERGRGRTRVRTKKGKKKNKGAKTEQQQS